VASYSFKKYLEGELRHLGKTSKIPLTNKQLNQYILKQAVNKNCQSDTLNITLESREYFPMEILQTNRII
jgi:hypothetical protein